MTVWVDGEQVPSIQYELAQGHGVGFDDMTAPWGLSSHGKLAIDGGYYNTFRIPFSRSVVVTAAPDERETKARTLYFAARGLENYPVIIQPRSAARFFFF